MEGSGGVAGAGLLVLLLLRPWRLPDHLSRDYAALVAAILLGLLLVGLCVPEGRLAVKQNEGGGMYAV